MADKKYSETELNESFDLKRSEFMTDDEMYEVDDLISTLVHNEGSLGDFYKDWSDIEEQYSNDQYEEEDMPNSRMNIIVSTIEGMITQIVDKKINTVTEGVGPEDEEFAGIARVGANWILYSNSITDILETYVRRRLKFGVSWGKVVFDKNYAGGFGLSRIQTPPINKVFVDRKIKDPSRLDEAEYIAEIINLSKTYAKQEYGKDKADIIKYGHNPFSHNEAFDEEDHIPDSDREWTMVQWWDRCEGKLRLREFSVCGVLLYDSHKPGTPKDNQKNYEYVRKSYYKYVDDKYPYFLTVKYPKEGYLYGFGDGKLLIKIQSLVNELYDKMRIQARPNAVGIDSNAEVDVESFDDNSYSPFYFNGAKLNGRPPMQAIAWGSVNRDLYEILMLIRTEMQRIVRYSDLMMGQSKTADTATEAAIQQQQGNSHVDWEKGVIERILAKMLVYSINLMMQFSETGKSLRIGDDKKEYEWVDFRNFANVPVQKPATQSFMNKFRKSNPGAPMPKYETMTDNKGKAVLKALDLDLKVSVGSGLPKNPAFIWSMIEKLSQLMIVDTDEKPPMQKPAINYKEFRKFLKDYLGVPISTDEEMKKFIEEFKKIQLQLMKSKMQQTGQAGQVGGNQPVPAMGGAEMSMGPGGPGGNQPMAQPETAGLTAGGGGEQGAIPNPAGVGGGFRDGK